MFIVTNTIELLTRDRLKMIGLALLSLAIGTFLALTAATPVHAANTILTSPYNDSNTNGAVDRIRWTMDENVTACVYEAGDWTVNTAGSINVVITGLSCTGTDAILNILVTADANETGGAVNPVISYANAGTAGSVTLTSGAMTAKANQTATDGAAPLALTISPASGATSVQANDPIIVTFTEPMTTAGFTVTVTPSVGVVSNVWTNGNATLTASHASSFTYGTAYNIVLAGTDASAALNTLSAGIQPINWNINTIRKTKNYVPGQNISTPTPAPETPTPAPTPSEPTEPIPAPEPMPVPEPEQPTEGPAFFGMDVDGDEIVEGSLIKSEASRAVYYVDASGVRHVFVNLQVYRSWYGDDFSDVVEVSESTIASIRLGRPVTMRPGKMIKLSSDPKVYLVVKNRGLRHITSEAIATNLFGPAWNKQITEEDITTFSSYEMLDPIVDNQGVDIESLNATDLTISEESL